MALLQGFSFVQGGREGVVTHGTKSHSVTSL